MYKPAGEMLLAALDITSKMFPERPVIASFNESTRGQISSSYVITGRGCVKMSSSVIVRVNPSSSESGSIVSFTGNTTSKLPPNSKLDNSPPSNSSVMLVGFVRLRYTSMLNEPSSNSRINASTVDSPPVGKLSGKSKLREDALKPAVAMKLLTRRNTSTDP